MNGPLDESKTPAGSDGTVARRGALGRLRGYFLTGLIVAGPLAVTIYITLWLINLIDGWFKPLVPARYNPDTYLPWPVPGFGLVIAFVVLTLLGFLTASLLGRSVVNLGEGILHRMPFVRGLYKGVKQVFETVFKDGGSSFRRVGLIEWPGPGLWSICFISEPARGKLAALLPPGQDHQCVFIPTTPNPTTGYLVMVSADRLVEIDVTPDEAFKLIMSMGIIQPEASAEALMDGATTAAEVERAMGGTAARPDARQDA